MEFIVTYMSKIKSRILARFSICKTKLPEVSFLISQCYAKQIIRMSIYLVLKFIYFVRSLNFLPTYILSKPAMLHEYLEKEVVLKYLLN